MRFAANEVIIEGEQFTNHVVELQGDILQSHYPLTKELPHTQWFRTLTIEGGRLVHTQLP